MYCITVCKNQKLIIQIVDGQLMAAQAKVKLIKQKEWPIASGETSYGCVESFKSQARNCENVLMVRPCGEAAGGCWQEGELAGRSAGSDQDSAVPQQHLATEESGGFGVYNLTTPNRITIGEVVS